MEVAEGQRKFKKRRDFVMVKATLATALLMFATIAVAHETADPGEHGAGTFEIQSVNPESPAEAAGMQAGDLLIELDGKELATQEDFAQIMAAHQPGDTVPLIVQREGEMIEMELTFGERPGGGVSVGVAIRITGMAPTGGGAGAVNCIEWLDKTYRLDSMFRDMGLELSDALETGLECVGRNQRMIPRYCDNVFKIHCSGLDLLAEVGEALVERCEEQLNKSLGVSLDQYKGWKTCAQGMIFDSYSMAGESSDASACKAAFLDKCGTNIDPASGTRTRSRDQKAFVACCSADVIDRESQGPDDCGMIDDSFSRGPCHEYPVCVDRFTSEWIDCSVLE